MHDLRNCAGHATEPPSGLKEQFHELTLHLDNIQDLFADPEAGSDRYVSGMDYLYSEIRIYPRHDKFKVTIELPPENITEGLVERIRTKMNEIFLYDWWPFRQNMRIYTQIADADIVIRESEAGACVGDKKVEQGLSLA